MGKQKSKAMKSHLAPEDRKMGKQHVYILIAMIVVGIALGFYHINN